jgi:lysyl-tRNA synthetase class 2
MKFRIQKKIFKVFGELNIGLVAARDVNNRGEKKEVRRLLEEQQERVRTSYQIESLSQQPKIQAWRKAYSSFGAKPKKHKSSVEGLYRMVLKGLELRHINTAVDIYNFISLKHMIPMGGDDLDRVEGDIVLTFARGNETFVPLNSVDSMPVQEGEVIYRDDVDVLCRRWNWRECDKTKMTEATRNILFVAEGLPPFSRTEVQDVVDELCDLLSLHCGGNFQTAVLDADKPEWNVD